MRINHNIPAMNAHRLLGVNNLAGSKTLEKLSSGKRINRAGDDAAGMAISEKMRAQVKGLTMASRNSLDGVSLVQTAEGAMGEVHSMLQRMRELAVQAANGTSADSDRQAIQDEINQLTSEINRISNGTEYNTRNIMKGNEGPDSNTTVQTMSTGQPAVVSNEKAYNIKSSINNLGGDIDSYKSDVAGLKGRATAAEAAATTAESKADADISTADAALIAAGTDPVLIAEATSAKAAATAAKAAAAAAKLVAEKAKDEATLLETAIGNFKTAEGIFTGAANTYGDAKVDYLKATDIFEKAGLKFKEDGNSTDYNLATTAFDTATNTFNTAKGIYEGTNITALDTARGFLDTAIAKFKTDAGTFEVVDSLVSHGETLSKYSGDLAEGYKGLTQSTEGIIISEKLQSETLTISINGDEVNVNLAGFTGVGAGLTINDLLKRINDSITEGAEAIINETGNIEIKTLGSGGDQVIEVSGSAVSKIFGGAAEALKGRGAAENPAKKSTGTFYFDKTPENGSKIKIGNEVIDIYDSSIEPYAGSNRAIDISDSTGQKKTPEQIVKEIAETIQIDGVTLSVETPEKAMAIRGHESYSSKRLVIESNNKGFEGNLISLEGTLDGFNTNLQVGANTGQGFRLEIGDIRANALKISATEPSSNPGVKGASYVRMPNVTDGISSNMVEYAVDVTEESKASAAIKVFDNAIVQVAKERSRLGATQNRLEHTIANLDNTAENLTAALSRIEDTDMAKEMSEFQKINVLQQAGVSMLAQANQQPQSILKLLG